MHTSFTVTPRYAVKMLEKALRLYTPSLSEKPMADFLADKCDDLGFEKIHTDDVGNLIATKGSGSPKILLCGHMDTVPGKIKVKKDGDFLYGRGASDAKAPLMAMLFAASTIQNNKRRRIHTTKRKKIRKLKKMVGRPRKQVPTEKPAKVVDIDALEDDMGQMELGNNAKLSFQDVKILLWQRIMMLTQTELRGGYYEKTYLSSGDTLQKYIKDERQIWQNSVRLFTKMIFYTLKKEHKDHYRQIEKKLNELKQEFMNKTKVNETVILSEAYYEDIQEKIALETLKVQTQELYEDWFEILSSIVSPDMTSQGLPLMDFIHTPMPKD